MLESSACVFLASAEGPTKPAIAWRGFGSGGRNVTQAIPRQRIQGSYDEFRSGRPDTYQDENMGRANKRAFRDTSASAPLEHLQHGRRPESLG